MKNTTLLKQLLNMSDNKKLTFDELFTLYTLIQEHIITIGIDKLTVEEFNQLKSLEKRIKTTDIQFKGMTDDFILGPYDYMS